MSYPIETVRDLLDELEGLCDGEVCIVVERGDQDYKYPIRKITRILAVGEKPEVLIRCRQERTET